MIKLTKRQVQELQSLYAKDFDGTIWFTVRDVLDLLEIGYDRHTMNKLIIDKHQIEGDE